jgi:hypothetical protein
MILDLKIWRGAIAREKFTPHAASHCIERSARGQAKALKRSPGAIE